ICSYPRKCVDNPVPGDVTPEDLDRHCAIYNGGRSVDLPAGVGCCTYFRRRCLNQVGPFDAVYFGDLYGRVIDFCLRAGKHGWRHLLAADTFVFRGGWPSGAAREQEPAILEAFHPGYRWEVTAHLHTDPAFPYRRWIDLARLKGPQPAVLHITQEGDGGERPGIDLARRPG